jgi:hypothetical protein
MRSGQKERERERKRETVKERASQVGKQAGIKRRKCGSKEPSNFF